MRSGRTDAARRGGATGPCTTTHYILAMVEHPSGLVAFLFTDVVGSTRLWATQPEAMSRDLELHDELIRRIVARHQGHLFFAAGDSFGAAFASANVAISAAVEIQRAMASTDWTLPDGGLSVRMGVHAGEAVERGGDYFGPPVNLTSRLMSAAHGGQIVVSGAASQLMTEHELRDLGEVKLRDIAGPVAAAQVVASGLAVDHPPLNAAGTGSTTLPLYRSSFVGREAEVDRVRSLLARHRLVTITGVGGAGKTRVATEAAAAEQAHVDGAFFVDLAAATSDDEVPAAFAAGIELSVNGADVEAELERYLKDRDVLLVVDNCEHLLDPVADLVDRLLSRSEQLRVVATSREALELEGEETFRLPSLAAEEAGLRLFVDRATAAGGGFELTSANHDVVVELCRRLDGMPLAIELAAARTRSATPEELLTGLEDRFALLRAGRRRGALQRQKTLEATIEWSYELLDADEQRFFRRLGVFVGPFLAELVPTVTETTTREARDLLDALVAKSLLTTSALIDGSTTYRLLESLRAYAIERLAAAGEVDQTADRHAQSVLQLFAVDGWLSDDESLLSFFRYPYQTAEVFAAFDHLLVAERRAEAVRLMVLGSFVLSGLASFVGWSDRVLELEREHRGQLDREHQAVVAGLVANKHMFSGEFLEAFEAAATGLDEYPDVDLNALRGLATTHAVALSVTEPDAAIEFVSESISRLEADGATGSYVDVWRVHLISARCLARDFDAAWAGVLDLCTAVNQGGYFSRVHGGWLARRLGHSLPPPPDAPGYGIVRAATVWRLSEEVATAMATEPDPERASRRVAAIADRHVTGRLAFEESEFLIAFAHLAIEAGDLSKAEHLLEGVLVRSPWLGWLLAEAVGAIRGWSDAEWHQHRLADTFSRIQPDQIEHIRSRGPALLRRELERWL